jgi:predicted ATPase
MDERGFFLIKNKNIYHASIMNHSVFVLTGPPCSGKTSVKKSLEDMGYLTMDEPQMEIVRLYQEEL